MRKKKNTDPCDLQEKDFEKQLAEVEFPDCDDGQSKRENEMIDLLKNLVNEYVRTSHVLTNEYMRTSHVIINQNSQVIELLTKLKERFI